MVNEHWTTPISESVQRSGAISATFPRDFEEEKTPRPFSAIDAVDELNGCLCETRELIEMLGKRTEFYRAAETTTQPSEGGGVRDVQSSGMANAITQATDRVREHNQILNHLLDTLR